MFTDNNCEIRYYNRNESINKIELSPKALKIHVETFWATDILVRHGCQQNVDKKFRRQIYYVNKCCLHI